MKKYYSVVICLLLTSLIVAQQKNATTDKRLTGLDTPLQKLLKDWHAAGFAVAVVEKNKVIYSKGFGYRDYEQKKPVTPNTLFAIGSCTKAFTASLLGILEKDGKVSLDKKVTDYLPSLHFYNNEMDEKITIRDMMCHRTGLPRHDFSWYLFKTASRDSLMMRLAYLQPSAGIREKWQYNNFMFLLQGLVTEKITGKSWEDNIREKIFTPLGMHRSNLNITDMSKDADAALGYLIKKDSVIKKVDAYNISGMAPAGAINSSVTEMANWLRVWINNGTFSGREVIPATYVKQAMGSQMVIGDVLPDKENPDINFSNYGLGWALTSYRGHYRVDHGGNIDGFTANTCFFPSDSIGIVVLANQNGSIIPTIVRNLIADRLLQLKYVNWNEDRKKIAAKAEQAGKDALKNVVSSRIPDTHPSHALSYYEGSYNNPGYGTVNVYKKNDSLFAYIVSDSMWIRHYHYDVFEIKGFDKEDGLDTSAGGSKINFRTGEDGKISGFSILLEPTVKPLEFTYSPKVKSVSTNELEKYVGEYELAGMTPKVYLKGNVLYVFVPGQPEYETVPIGNHTFKLKIIEGFSVKFDVTDDKVTAMNFIQPNGTFKAKRKN